MIIVVELECMKRVFNERDLREVFLLIVVVFDCFLMIWKYGLFCVYESLCWGFWLDCISWFLMFVREYLIYIYRNCWVKLIN